MRHYLAAEVSELLYVAIKENWQSHAKELEDLANRLFPSRQNMPKPLRFWIEWLEIEKVLEISPDPKTGKTEIPFLKQVTENTLVRLTKLVLAPSQGETTAELRKPLERLAKN